MKCSECGQQEATIHETVIINGKAMEQHLCEECAQKAGIGGQGHLPLHELVSSFVKTVSPESGQTTLTCAVCGLSYARFKQTGLLGCASCYRTFEEKLGPLIERAHEGATHHVGKIPRGALERSRQGGAERLESLLGSSKEREERLAALRRQLASAVEAEHYEQAASLRDEIRKLDELEYGDA